MLIRPYLHMPPRGTPLNRDDPIVRKLVMCVPFNEGTGANAWDLVHGFKGDIRSNTLWDASPLGACLHFQGNINTDGITLVDHEVFDFGSDDFFLSAWVQRLASGTAWHQLITKDASGARSFCFEFYYNSDKVRILTFNGGNPYDLTSNAPITDTNCHHVLAQRIGTTFQIWIDGKLDASNTSGNYGNTDTTATPVTLGRRNYAGYENPLNGQMFMSMAGRGHLKPDEVRRLYAEPFSIFEPRKVYTSGGGAAGWLSDWAKRIEITVNSAYIDEDVTHYPIPIILGASVGEGSDDLSCIFDEVGSNRKKIAVTKYDGTTQIYVEIDYWDETAEKAVLWVSKSDLTLASASPTTLYIYYDSSKPDNTGYVSDVTDAAAQNVWDSDFVGVWNMAQDPTGGSGCIKDSTSNGNHGTPNGSMTTGDLVVGPFGKALDLDGNDDEVEIPDDGTLDIGTAITIEVLVNPASITGFGGWVGKGFSPTAVNYYFRHDDGKLEFYFRNVANTANRQYETTADPVTQGSWQDVAFKHEWGDGTKSAMFHNGTKYAGAWDAGGNDSPEQNTQNLCLGGRGDDQNFPGKMALVRISEALRSDAWLKLNHYAFTDGLLSYGSEEIYGGPSITIYSQDCRVLFGLAASQDVRVLNRLAGGATVRLKGGIAGAVTMRLKSALAAVAHYRLKILAPAGKDWRLLNALPATVDRRLLNRLAAGMAKDARLRNRIAGLYQTDTRLRNAIEGTARYIRDIGLRNLLLPTSAARHISNTWDAAIAGSSIKEHCRHLRITLNENSFTNEVEIEFHLGRVAGSTLTASEVVSLAKAHQGTGQDALVVTIDGTAYKFMVEETTREHTPPAMTVWGRSLTAKLADPFYSKPVSKTWDTPTLASNIVAELAPGFTVDFQIEDFVVPAGVLAAENDMPLDVIREIAERSQGGLVRSGIAGELILRPRRPTAPRDIKAATPAATWWDGDDLLSLSDDFEPAEGWNAVTVKGKTSIAGAGIYVELDSERNNNRTTFLPGQDAFVRVYTSPIGAAYEHQVTMGTAAKLGTYTQTITDEEIQVQDGRAGTRYPILSVQALDFDGRVLSGPEWEQGGKEIRFNVAEGCSGSAYLKLDYKTKYDLWKVKADQAGKAILCLEEQ
jgi:hypothetical protein